MQRVFISSTYIDLKAYREAVAKMLREAQFTAIDMADFGARTQEPTEVCLQEIHDADMFVGIYAYRYGFIPKNETFSITEAEFHYAKKLGKPILCYLIDTDYPWKPSFCCHGQDEEKLKSFKKFIEENNVRNTFTSPDDLAAKVIADILSEMNRDHAGQRLITDKTTTKEVLGILGLDPHILTAAEAQHLKITESIKQKRKIKAGDLRSWLLHGGHGRLRHPYSVTVDGVMQPYVLMHSGWWETENEEKKSPVRGLREWLLFGFQEWAPSWGYAWTASESASGLTRTFHLGQIADDMCDEAESIPVYIPAEKASRLTAEFQQNPGGLKVEVTGVVTHRTHFCPRSLAADRPQACQTCDQQPECLADRRFGGTLDFCLVIMAGESSHGILIKGPAEFYSGYLWKCLVPKNIVTEVTLANLKDSFFVWEHTNFADPEAVAFNLDSLNRKQTYLEAKYGSMHLLQKSSALVPGIPELSSDDFYKQLVRGPHVRI